MRLELIVPMWTREERKKRSRRARIFKLPPTGLINLASITPKDIEVVLTDENIERIRFNKDPDLVGITVTTASAPRAYEVADIFRSGGVPVVMGGPHVTYLYEEALHHADSVVIGECEWVWLDFLEDFKKGGISSVKKTYKAEKKPEMAAIPLPRTELIVRKNKRYIGNRAIHLTRGCPHHCSFCTVTDSFGKKIRYRPVEQVIEFVEQHIGNSLAERFFMFMDDNIMAHRGYAKRLFKALIPYKIIWMSQASINSAYDEEMLELAAKSGCKGLFVGIETISKKALQEVGKSQNKVEFYKTAIKRFHKHGIFIEGGFIFGFDSDEKDVFEKTVKFVNMIKLDGIQYSILTPLPGTRFFKKIEEEDRFISKDWADYDCANVVFRPKNMTPLELKAGLHYAYKRTYSFLSIFRRSIGALQNIRRIKYYFFLLIFNFGHRVSCRKWFKTAWNPNRGSRRFFERLKRLEEFSKLIEYECGSAPSIKIGYNKLYE